MKITKEDRMQINIDKHNKQIDGRLNDIYLSKPWRWKKCSKCESSFKREKLWAVIKYVCGGIDSRGFHYTAYLCMNCAHTIKDAHKIWFAEEYMKAGDPKWNWDYIESY